MKKYRELPKQSTLDKEILKFWREENIFQKSINNRHSKPNFTFYEGPPSANGLPGIHHVVGRTVKDIFCRYKTMSGHHVMRKAGWDTHGLPVELAAEKKLNIKKEDIGKKISIEDYNKVCENIVFEYKQQWDNLTEKIGYWVDMENPYITCNNSYIESVWSVFKKIYDENLVYKGYSIQPYSPAAGTGLSSHELNQQGCYKNVKDTTIVAQFKISNTNNEYFLAWTTTPWTLPANAALAVGETINYVKIKTFNRYTGDAIFVFMAKECISKYFTEKTFNDEDFSNYNHGDREIPWKIVETMTGKSLLEKKYDQLMPYIPGEENYFKIIAGDFVTTTEGTGIVHIAPTFGADDMRVAKQNNIEGIFVKNEINERVPIVTREGKYVNEIKDFAGRYVKKEYEPQELIQNKDYKSLDEDIAITLKQENKAFLVQKYEHSYPHCWRTDKPILYYPLDAWFIKTTAVKETLIDLNKKIKWQPEHVGEKRFGNWLENLVDWNISRERFWGTPLPIWVTKDKSEEKCIGSINELQEEIKKSIQHGFINKNFDDNVNLHRPCVDHIILVSQKGEKMYREKDIIDVWFDSGAMPYAQFHYPFENEDLFNENFPADFIAEGVDQTRGWFFTLHVISSILKKTVAFKRVFVNGLVLDKNGIKMSKRLGNTIEPLQLIEKYGADAVRWYTILNFNISDNIKFNEEGVKEVKNKFFGTLENTYKFFELYANIDEYAAQEILTVKDLPEIDRWIVSRLHTTIKNVTLFYENFDTKSVTQAIQTFLVDDLSNWYVRQNRKRFWQSEINDSKKRAYDILFTALLNIAKLMAPIAPFYSEAIYRCVSDKSRDNSVHLEDFPVFNGEFIDVNLEKKMNLAQKISSAVHAMRKKSKIKVRQPLGELEIECINNEDERCLLQMESLILKEINVKTLTILKDKESQKEYSIKPNFASINKKVEKENIKETLLKINNLNNDEKRQIFAGSTMVFVLDNGMKITLTPDDFLISQIEEKNKLSASFDGIKISLKTEISRELLLEGIAREIISKIQNLRKESSFEVTDKIILQYHSQDQNISTAIENNIEYISRETQATKIEIISEPLENCELLELDDSSLFVKISKLPK